MAELVIALGLGFEAGVDAHFVIETMRGHNLGRIIEQGSATKNTGIPGKVDGESEKRVIYSPAEGRLKIIKDIGEFVKKSEIIAEAGNVQIESKIDGIVRGMVAENYYVKKGMKIADIDPRTDEIENCYTISDKARCIAGSVLEILVRNINKS